MKKIYKRISSLLIGLMAVAFMLPMPVLAAGTIDLEQNVNLTISYQNGGKALSGAKFEIYEVASTNQNGDLTTTKEFSQFNVDIQGKNDQAWKKLATTLEGYVLRDHIAPADSGKTDKNGILSFPTGNGKLEPGLYLVIGKRHTQGKYRYDAYPFMVMLPTQDSNGWNYQVTADVKSEASRIPDDHSPSSDTITRKVLKVWKDDGKEQKRPKEIIVQLLRDGEVYDTVTLNMGNDWRYTWYDLSNEYTWNIVEKECPGYTVEISREGKTFVVTNTASKIKEDTPTDSSDSNETPTPSDETPKKRLPQTGQLWWPVPILLVAGLLFIVIGVVRYRGDKK